MVRLDEARTEEATHAQEEKEVGLVDLGCCTMPERELVPVLASSAANEAGASNWSPFQVTQQALLREADIACPELWAIQ